MSEQTTTETPAVERASSHSYTEAPASFTVKVISSHGFDCMLTIRDENTASLMLRVGAALDWLQANGFTPPYFPKGKSGNGNAPAGGDANAPTCQYHGPMKRSTKFNGWYCPSKMGDGSYCKEQVKS